MLVLVWFCCWWCLGLVVFGVLLVVSAFRLQQHTALAGCSRHAQGAAATAAAAATALALTSSPRPAVQPTPQGESR